MNTYEFAIRPAATDVALDRIAALANEIWHEYYVPLIGLEQVNYMISHFQCYPELKKQVAQGYEYFQIFSGEHVAGYVGIRAEQDALFLSKLYIHKEFRGQHLTRHTMEFLLNLCRERSISKIWLTCNRHNEQSLAIYKHFGFEITREEKTDIGGGYQMDDYILELVVKQ